MVKGAVLVIDMLRGFLEPESAGKLNPLYCGEESRKIIPAVLQEIQAALLNNDSVIFCCDSHYENDKEFAMFPPHCIAGTESSLIIPELIDFISWPNVYVEKKNRYSAFFGTNLDALLDGVEKLTVVGVCTDICVLHTVADARNRDYLVEIPFDCVASFDLTHHSWALEHMEKILGAEVV